jgi:hypothetical protein
MILTVHSFNFNQSAYDYIREIRANSSIYSYQQFYPAIDYKINMTMTKEISLDLFDSSIK